MILIVPILIKSPESLWGGDKPACANCLATTKMMGEDSNKRKNGKSVFILSYPWLLLKSTIKTNLDLT